MQTIHAIFENGVFRPVVPVELPEQAEFAFEPRLVPEPAAPETIPFSAEGLRNVYAILGERFASGQCDTAERHEDHQPSL